MAEKPEVIIQPRDYWQDNSIGGGRREPDVPKVPPEPIPAYIPAYIADARAKRQAKPVSRPYGIIDRAYDRNALNLSCSYPLERILSGLRRFAEQLRQGTERVPNCCMLFYGLPGTGKSEFGKYLARELGMRLYVRRGSDLLNCYVGETEKSIRDAFEAAGEPDTLFMIDEADSFINSRRSADHQWEVTQVNEFLCRMEEFRGILICSTNFDDRLDEATARRFTFKIRFEPLTDSGKKLLAERMLSEVCTLPEDLGPLYALAGLTPGDFRTVRNRMLIVNPGPVSFEECLEELKLELKYRAAGAR